MSISARMVSMKRQPAPDQEWKSLEPTGTTPDPWQVPSHRAPAIGGSPIVDRANPFHCLTCSQALSAETAHALNGEMYCAACAPSGAVSGSSLPPDSTPFERSTFRVLKELGELLSRTMTRFRF